MRQKPFKTQELALAAYLKAQGQAPEIIPPTYSSGFVQFAFHGNLPGFEVEAKAFTNGAEVCATDYYQALNSLRAEIRYARGVWR